VKVRFQFQASKGKAIPLQALFADKWRSGFNSRLVKVKQSHYRRYLQVSEGPVSIPG